MAHIILSSTIKITDLPVSANVTISAFSFPAVVWKLSSCCSGSIRQTGSTVRRLSIEQSAAVEFGQRVGQRQTDTASLLVFCLFEAVERIEYISISLSGIRCPSLVTSRVNMRSSPEGGSNSSDIRLSEYFSALLTRLLTIFENASRSRQASKVDPAA